MYATLDIDGLSGPLAGQHVEPWEGHFARPSFRDQGRDMWTAEEVVSQLGSALDPLTRQRFIEDDIDGSALFNLTEADLQDIYEISESGARRDIIRFVNQSRMFPA